MNTNEVECVRTFASVAVCVCEGPCRKPGKRLLSFLFSSFMYAYIRLYFNTVFHFHRHQILQTIIATCTHRVNLVSISLLSPFLFSSFVTCSKHFIVDDFHIETKNTQKSENRKWYEKTTERMKNWQTQYEDYFSLLLFSSVLCLTFVCFIVPFSRHLTTLFLSRRLLNDNLWVSLACHL